MVCLLRVWNQGHETVSVFIKNGVFIKICVCIKSGGVFIKSGVCIKSGVFFKSMKPGAWNRKCVY